MQHVLGLKKENMQTPNMKEPSWDLNHSFLAARPECLPLHHPSLWFQRHTFVLQKERKWIKRLFQQIKQIDENKNKSFLLYVFMKVRLHFWEIYTIKQFPVWHLHLISVAQMIRMSSTQLFSQSELWNVGKWLFFSSYWCGFDMTELQLKSIKLGFLNSLCFSSRRSITFSSRSLSLCNERDSKIPERAKEAVRERVGQYLRVHLQKGGKDPAGLNHEIRKSCTTIRKLFHTTQTCTRRCTVPLLRRSICTGFHSCSALGFIIKPLPHHAPLGVDPHGWLCEDATTGHRVLLPGEQNLQKHVTSSIKKN